MASGKKTSTQPVLSQSLFNTAYVPSRGWGSYATSTGLHGALILALLLITFPVLKDEIERHRVENITLIAPQIPRPAEKIPPPLKHLPTPQPVRPEIARNQPKPKIPPMIKPPEPKPVIAKPVEIAAAPEIKVTPVVPPTPQPENKPLPPAPKPQIRMGAFQTADAAKAQRAPDAVKVGGFGDPNGVHPSADSRATNTVARLGSFDLPPGEGNSGGGGRSASGGFRQTSFGGAGQTGGTPGGTGHGGGSVHTGGFGEGVSAAPQMTQVTRQKPAEPVFTPVEILSKPRPVYTQEARSMKLEGEVALEVVFLSSGSVRILRITHGLGHGLDEAAEQAAQQVRFRPATRGGVPVDANATIHITFQLT